MRLKVSVHVIQRESVTHPLEREVRKRVKKPGTTKTQKAVARTVLHETCTQAKVVSRVNVSQALCAMYIYQHFRRLFAEEGCSILVKHLSSNYNPVLKFSLKIFNITPCCNTIFLKPNT